MTFWEWMYDFRIRAARDGDRERVRLTHFHHQAYEYRETNPEQSLALIEEGRRLARLLHEPWWSLYYDDYRVVVLICFLRDYRQVLEYAVQNTLEVRKPQYEQFPETISIHRNLVETYIGIDPHGYADSIQQALEHLQALLPPEGEDKYLVLGSRTDFYLDTGSLDRAEESAQEMLALADADEDEDAAQHHATFTYSDLCEIAYKKGNWQALQEWAEAGEVAARGSDLQMQLCESLLWQALGALNAGEEKRARSLYRRATLRVRRLKMPPVHSVYDALCAYHLLDGQPMKALKIRRRELKTIAGMGRLAYECQCRIHLCRLLAQLEEPLEADLLVARESARKLRQPEPYLKQLEQIQ